MKPRHGMDIRTASIPVLGLLSILLICAQAAAQPLNFVDIGADLEGGSHAKSQWGDIDGDGDLDLVTMGGTLDGGRGARIYRNDDGVFVDIEAPLIGVIYSSCCWADYDNDNDIDLLIAGISDDGRHTQLFRNDAGVFSDSGLDFVDLRTPTLAWGDYDNDGDLDLYVSGNFSSYSYTARLYRNEGDGFTELRPLEFLGHTSGTASWIDFDYDGDLDLFCTGNPVDPLPNLTDFYVNEGDDQWSVYRPNIEIVYGGGDDWFDYDGDGDLDLLLCGSNGSGVSTALYENDESFFFAVEEPFVDVSSGSLDWGDVDNDGDMDLLLTGNRPITVRESRIYLNQDGQFNDTETPLLAVAGGMGVWGDYDADGDLDIFLLGVDEEVIPSSKVYRNDFASPNTLPAPPTGLRASETEAGILLEWDRAIDAETPQLSLTYNLRVGTTASGVEIMSPMANLETGRRLVVDLGNTNTRNRWELKGLASGEYTWSVQAIDGAYAGSVFAAEEQFSIGLTGVADTPAPAGLAASNHPNPFNPSTLIEFTLDKPARTSLLITDSLGRMQVRLLDDELLGDGRHGLTWNGRDAAGRELPSGLYLYRIEAGARSHSGRMLLLK